MKTVVTERCITRTYRSELRIPEKHQASPSAKILEWAFHEMTKQGVTQSDLARHLGVTQARISQMFRCIYGRPRITLELLYKLCAFFGKRLDIKIVDITK